MHRTRPRVGILLLGILFAVSFGCREEVPPLFRRNRPPETTLTIIPEQDQTAFYRYHVYWRGVDPDGEVVRYLFAVTDSLNPNEEQNWDPSLALDRDRGIYTTRSDSVFLFNSSTGKQAFNIVAIDDYGERDPTPARAQFGVVNNGPPTIRFLGVEINSNNPRVLPCGGAEPFTPAPPCTIPTFTDFRMRFTGETGNGIITGYTWSPNSDFWEPYHTRDDTLYLNVEHLQGPAGAVDSHGRPIWALSSDHDTVTVFVRSSRTAPVPPRNFLLRAKCQDQARQVSDINRGGRTVTVNYDPDTRLYTIPKCDCPTAPPGCNSSDRVPVGWVIGIGEVPSFPEDQWRIICPGDTIPNLSYVRFYATGWDDSRDLPIDSLATTLPEVAYRFRFEFFGPDFSSTNMQFSSPPVLAQELVPPPGTPADPSWTGRGAAIDWETCPFEYRFEAGAVDEHQRVDGTPAPMTFVVGGAPVVDSLAVPKVMVFVPRCTASRQPFCTGFEPIAFGPDTLAVYGTPVPDAPIPPWATPLGLGWNDFVFPFRAWAHDHPRDRNPPGGPNYYTDETVGRIRAWNFTFNCSEPGCQDLSLTGENQWRENRSATVDGEDTFAENLQVRIALDTLCLDPACATSRARLDSDRFGTFVFSLQGRDTDYIQQSCPQPSDLGAGHSTFPIPIAELGRVTRLEQRQVVWRQLADVRPVHKPGAAPGVTAIRGGPFMPRKKLMQ
jgi:hypothetical protein